MEGNFDYIPQKFCKSLLLCTLVVFRYIDLNVASEWTLSKLLWNSILENFGFRKWPILFPLSLCLWSCVDMLVLTYLSSSLVLHTGWLQSWTFFFWWHLKDGAVVRYWTFSNIFIIQYMMGMLWKQISYQKKKKVVGKNWKAVWCSGLLVELKKCFQIPSLHDCIWLVGQMQWDKDLTVSSDKGNTWLFIPTLHPYSSKLLQDNIGLICSWLFGQIVFKRKVNT